MKRIILALAIVALVLPATRSAQAADVSVDFFYDNLNTGGSWVDAGDYGYAWQPEIAVSNRNWRPYTDGYWAYTDVGWTWVSNENFGWATYHYGRWARVRDRGWIWVPGREWAPAWVSCRTGGDHVGWAPLPPRRGYRSGSEVVYEGRPINGYVDIDFDIGPAYYNFVDIRYIGGSGLRQRILPYDQNVGYVTNTVNVTNITYNNNTVYNYGPDYNRMSAYSTQPIQRLTLRRDANADLSAAVQAGSVTSVQGDTLIVAAPQQFQAAQKNAAPKEVKTKIAKDDLETGWSGVSDEKQKEKMQAQMKKEDRKSIPPTKIEPQNPEALKAAAKDGDPVASPAATAEATPAAMVAPGADAKGKGKKDREKNGKDAVASPAPSIAASPAAATDASPAASVAPSVADEKGKGKGRGKNRVEPTPAATAAPGAEAPPASDAIAPKADKKNGRGKGKQDSSAAPAPAASAEATVAPAAQEEPSNNRNAKKDRKGRDKKAESTTPATAEPSVMTPPPAAPPAREQKKNRKPDMQTSERPLLNAEPVKSKEPAAMEAPRSEPAPDANRDGRGRGNKKAAREESPAQPAPQEAAPRAPQAAPPQAAAPEAPASGRPDKGRGKGNGKNKKGDEPEPEPEG